jgi:hypothetical protein
MSDGHDDYGSSPAAWTTVTIIILAFVAGVLGLILGNWVMFGIACAAVPLGAIVGKIMVKLGYGFHKPREPRVVAS